RARQGKQAWVEAVEMAMAKKLFEKAQTLLDLPHLSKKGIQIVNGKEETYIINPTNASYFNAAVNMAMKGSELARRPLGLPIEVKRSERTGAGGGAIATRNDGMDEASDEQVQHRVVTLARGAIAAVEGHDVESMAGDAAGPADDDPA